MDDTLIYDKSLNRKSFLNIYMDDTLSHCISTALLSLLIENRKALLYHGSTYLPYDSY